MKRPSNHGFTLVELLVVMAVIVILVSLVLGVNTMAQYKAASHRATGEIAAISAACANYKNDNGTYPREPGVTEPVAASGSDCLDPRTDATPAGTSATAKKYQKASEFLYMALSGDTERTYKAPKEKSYYEFKPDVLNATKNNGVISRVNWIQDPWGNAYGYSTANAKQEEEYADTLRTDPKAERPSKPQGYSPTFDLWSTGGSNSSTAGTTAGPFRDSPKWIKNW